MSLVVDSWAEWVIRGLALSSVLLLIAWAIHALMGRRLSARVAHLLALLPLLPLVLPRWTTFEAPPIRDQTLQTIAERTGFAQPTEAERDRALVGSHVPQYVSGAAPKEFTEIAPELLAEKRTLFTGLELLFFVWALGVLTLGAGFVRNLRRTHAVVQQARPLPSDQARRIHRLVPATRRVRLLESEALASPAAWGLRDRCIVLPMGLMKELHATQLAWVLRHELAHHARRDLQISFLQRMVQIVWWFHPALWWWSSRIELTRECACDEQATHGLDGNRRPAATALLAVAERPRLQPHAAMALHSSSNPVNTMKTRLTRLLQPRPSRLAGVATASLCLLLAGGSLLLSQSAWATVLQEPVEVEPPAEIVEEVPEVVEIIEEVEPEEIVEEVEDPNGIADQIWQEEPPAPHGFRFGEAPPGFAAQAWLLNQQRDDGSWATGTKTDAPSGEYTTIGNTALVLLALERRHPALPEERWEHAVRRGLAALGKSFDEESGRFASPGQSYRSMHDHLMATYATLRLRQFASGDGWDRIRSGALAAIEEARNPYMGWRFSFQPEGDNDSFTTSLALRTLAEGAQARNSRLATQTLEGGLSFLKSMTDPDSGRVGYQKAGGEDPRFRLKYDDYPTKYTELCTAVATLARAANGLDPLDDPTALRSLTLIAAKPPVWNMTHGSVDYYYWMFGAEAMNLVGGRLAERWHHSLRQALRELQSPAGSWPAVDAWATAGADIHSTACALLAWQAASPQSSGGR